MNNCEAGVSFGEAVGAERSDYAEIFVRVTALEDEIAGLKQTLKLLERQLGKVG